MTKSGCGKSAYTSRNPHTAEARMADPWTKEQRSRVMSRVKNKNTKPEVQVRSILHRMGYRFRLHRRDLPGAPDIVLPRHRKAIFVHGCFWHSHDCPRGKRPSTRPEFWKPNSTATSSATGRTARRWKRWDGVYLRCGSANLKTLTPWLQSSGFSSRKTRP